MKSYQEFMERSLTTKEKSEKERIVKGMKKNKSSFKSNYKDDAESVMYATATKLAKEEKKNCGCGKDPCITYGKKKKVEEEVKRDEYGDPIGGPKISKKQLKKNLASNEKDEKITHSEAAAWTKKSGKKKSGGLNEKGRKSYERENPGSDLKAPSKKVGNPRRASFCARMKGMKKKLTSKKTASDPDSRINKSLRAWNCSYQPEGTPLIELNRYAKETGKNTGSMNKPKGSSVQKGGSKDKALNFVRSKIRKDSGRPEGQQKKEKGVKTTAGAGKYKAMADKKRKTAADAKKRGFKSTQDYANTMARYGGKDNYDKGRGLGS